MRTLSSLAFLCMLIIVAAPPEANCRQPEGQQLCIYAPLPEYPLAARARHLGGSGMFVLHLDRKTGTVKSVTIEKSTGSPILDHAAIDCLKRWRFIRNIDLSTVKVPFTYTTTGLLY
jgi:TonB family protein